MRRRYHYEKSAKWWLPSIAQKGSLIPAKRDIEGGRTRAHLEGEARGDKRTVRRAKPRPPVRDQIARLTPQKGGGGPPKRKEAKG